MPIYTAVIRGFTLNVLMFPLLTRGGDSMAIEHFPMFLYPFYGPHSINRILFTIFYVWYIAR